MRARGWLTALLILALTVVASSSGADAKSTTLTGLHRALASGRTYWLSGTGNTLVIGLPGTGLDAQNANDTFWSTGNAATTGWQQHARDNGYVLALGESLAGDWNVGGGWAGGPQDDVGYLLAIVADAAAVDGPFARVFVAGFSAGGALAWDACALHPEVFTACGSASGWAPVPATTPIDFWHVHGTADTTVPIRGGAGTRSFVFPAALSEAAHAPRGSRVVLEPTSGGHGTAGWMAARLWSFWTAGR